MTESVSSRGWQSRYECSALRSKYESSDRLPFVMLDADLEVGSTNKHSNQKGGRQEGRGRRREGSNAKPLKAKELSGFLLLDHSKVELPEDAIEASLVDLGLTSIKIDDMNYFPNLAYLNLSDNFLRLEDLYCLPSLHDLNLSCNAIQNIYTLKRGFRGLARLNLSFNNLSTHALHMLNELQALKYLDLTGNHLNHLPPDLLVQSPIETLLLTSNNLSSEEDIITLSKIPKIKYLDVGRNQFKSVPDDAVMGFSHLVTLNMSFNQIDNERDVLCILKLRRLSVYHVYGNPFLARGGSGMNVGETVLLGPIASQKGLINVISLEPLPPRRGDYSVYSDVSLKILRKDTIPSAREWRKRGQEKRLKVGREEMMEERHSSVEELVTAARMDERGLGSSDGGGEVSFFVTEGAIDRRAVEEVTSEDEEVERQKRERYFGSLEVPSMVLQRNLFSTSKTAQDSTKLRTVIQSLRYALQHPLTTTETEGTRSTVGRGEGDDHVDVVEKTSPPPPHRAVNRGTALTKGRQRPRMNYVPLIERKAKAKVMQAEMDIPDDLSLDEEETPSLQEVSEDRITPHAAAASDTSLESLIAMVNRVMMNYSNPHQAHAPDHES